METKNTIKITECDIDTRRKSPQRLIFAPDASK